MEAEIIEFVRPDSGRHSLYITSIPAQLDERELNEILEQKFSPFGLLYEIQVINTNPCPTSPKDQQLKTEDNSESSHVGSKEVFGISSSNLFAFVKFYSYKAAATAKKELTGRLYIHGTHLKIKYSTRPEPDEPQPLYATKCYEVANHYLGYNGWCVNILLIKANDEHSKIKPDEVQYICGIKLSIVNHGITCEGYGVATIAQDIKDPSTKSVAICHAEKQSYHQAVQNAFRKVLLVVLENGKVYAEVNGTVEDRVYCDDQLTVDNILKVNDLDLDPDETDPDGFNDSLDVDVVNQQLLEELEYENT